MHAVHIKSGRCKYIVVAREDFLGWPETVGLVKITAKAVGEWFTSELICSYDSPNRVTFCGGPYWGNNFKMKQRNQVQDSESPHLITQSLKECWKGAIKSSKMT
ncbi:hypothetical protein O181_008236 [Austropuccinia psidii MF-1]|uniref:Uncharacterized protein n=1 Tax=Austropuccinia psidii MF-1 TaxID=1389203 RepID=A0A9Q3GIB8_9BASI|nr:hypothetical protein [Austropuccinia psidii MF-1]